MYITVEEFLAGAFDNYYNLIIYDFSVDDNVYNSDMEGDGAIDNFLDYEVHSWQVGEDTITLNIDTKEE